MAATMENIQAQRFDENLLRLKDFDPHLTSFEWSTVENSHQLRDEMPPIGFLSPALAIFFCMKLGNHCAVTPIERFWSLTFVWLMASPN
jgi:hypothetical protein